MYISSFLFLVKEEMKSEINFTFGGGGSLHSEDLQSENGSVLVIQSKTICKPLCCCSRLFYELCSFDRCHWWRSQQDTYLCNDALSVCGCCGCECQLGWFCLHVSAHEGKALGSRSISLAPTHQEVLKRRMVEWGRHMSVRALSCIWPCRCSG